MSEREPWMPSDSEIRVFAVPQLLRSTAALQDIPSETRIIDLACHVAKAAIEKFTGTAVKKALAEQEAQNKKLRKCVEAADDFVETVVTIETSQAMHRVYSVALAHGAPYNGMDWSKQLSTYRAARAEVDKP